MLRAQTFHGCLLPENITKMSNFIKNKFFQKFFPENHLKMDLLTSGDKHLVSPVKLHFNKALHILSLRACDFFSVMKL